MPCRDIRLKKQNKQLQGYSSKIKVQQLDQQELSNEPQVNKNILSANIITYPFLSLTFIHVSASNGTSNSYCSP